ncbi:unnamed protein product [Trifolium pratense]|uniref:Uncharacterized protein n=1 Tax=Trifolium pratense TaxID=57577 RepID=A0ACB0IXJ3_TRIPR|nr:unnamed protein product [Trifolium pratense]
MKEYGDNDNKLDLAVSILRTKVTSERTRLIVVVIIDGESTKKVTSGGKRGERVAVVQFSQLRLFVFVFVFFYMLEFVGGCDAHARDRSGDQNGGLISVCEVTVAPPLA